MDWNLNGNSFVCLRDDCTKKPGKPCGHCGMPDVAPDVRCILKLYSRCQKYHCLPYSGGVLEQPAWIMDLFGLIEGLKESHKQEQDADKKAEDAVK